MRPLAAILLAAVVTLAGCVGLPSGTTEPAADDGPGTGTPATAQPIPLAGTGRSETLACVDNVVCRGRGSTEIEVPLAPNRSRITGAFAWDDGPTGTPTMQAYLLIIHEDGSWSWEEGIDPSAEGPSPLEIDWDLTPYEGRTLLLHLASDTRAGPVWYGMSQEWAFEGEVFAGAVNRTGS